MKLKYNNQIVEAEINFSRNSEDCYVQSACYTNGQEIIDDEELDTIGQQNADLIYEEWFQYMVCEAEYAYENDR